MKWLGITACLAISACTTSVASFEPYIVDVTDHAALDRDKAQCLQIAEAYKPGIDLGAIASQGAQAAISNVASAAVSPLAPALSGAGAAGSETLNQIGILGMSRTKVYLRCLDNRGRKSGFYSVVDPNF